MITAPFLCYFALPNLFSVFNTMLFYTESHAASLPLSCMSDTYQLTMEPLDQTVGCGVRDLAAETLPFLCVHQLQDAPQVFQKVKRPKAAHERRGGRLAVKQPIGVVQRLGA